MKKLICYVLAIVILVTSCAVVIATSEKISYTLAVKVVDINNDEITVIDEQGNLWAFYGNDNFNINQNLLISLNDNNTDTIYDDIIEDVKY